MSEQVLDEGELPPRSFTRLLATLAEGDADRDLTEAWGRLLVQTRKSALFARDGAKGSLTLKLNAHIDDRDEVTMTYSITVKEPTKPTSKDTRWLDQGGRIVDESPRQQKLPLQQVPKRGQDVNLEPENQGESS